MSSLTQEILEALDNGDLDLAQELIIKAKSKENKNADHIHTMEPKEKKYGSRQKFKKRSKTDYFDDKSIPSDPKFDIALKAIRTEPNRKLAPKLVKATCRICGRTEKVNPMFVTKTIGDDEVAHYRCNKCCGGF